STDRHVAERPERLPDLGVQDVVVADAALEAHAEDAGGEAGDALAERVLGDGELAVEEEARALEAGEEAVDADLGLELLERQDSEREAVVVLEPLLLGD